MRKKLFATLAGLALALPLASAAWADSITPETFSATLAVGESVTVTKTVVIDQTVSGNLDVLFLFDTTGSMGGLITSAQTSASEILTSLSTFGDDVRFGVAHYEDFPTFPWGASTDVPYALLADIGSATAAQTAINSLSLGNGSDWPESNLYALQQAATTTSWRDDATRVIVWFGDAEGHDPNTTTGYPGPTLAQAIGALTGNTVVVTAIDLSGMDDTGQVTAITTATGGSSFTGAVNAGTIAATIEGLVGEVFATYGEVFLDLTGVPGGVGASVDPVSYVGDFSRNATETFTFDVTFTGLVPGDYSFSIVARTDRFVVGSESDRITVGEGVIPEPGTLLLLGTGLLGLAGAGRRKKK